MTLTEDELARPLTAEEEATLREWVRRGHKPWVHGGDFILVENIDRLLATLDALRAAPVADTAGIDAARLAAARFVATHWRDSYLAEHAKGGSTQWALGTHPLALVLAALDGETDPRQLGLPESQDEALAAALRTPKPEGER